MAIPNSIYLDCPSCGEKTLHEVLKGRLSKGRDTLETTVKCQQCGHVQNAVVHEPRPVKVPIIVSDMGKSKRSEVEFGEDELVELDQELFVDDGNIVITAIEKGERRVPRAMAGEVSAIWAKKFDKVRVKISVNKNTKTLAAELFALPEEEFFVGDLMTIGREEVVIHNIKTKDGAVHSGGVAARDIVRIYAKSARHTKG